MKNKTKIAAVAVICVLTVAVSLTGGLVLDKRSVAVPAVEIIEAEESTAGTEVAMAAKNTQVIESEAEIVVENVMTASVEIMHTKDIVTDTIININGLININTATADELMTLDGVGEKTAAAIIEYRKDTPFNSIEEIKSVKGIGDKKFEKMKDRICV